MVDFANFLEAVQLTEYRRNNIPTPPQYDAMHVENWVTSLEELSLKYESNPADGRNAAKQMDKYRVAYRQRPPLSRYEIIDYYLYLAVKVEDTSQVYNEHAKDEIRVDFTRLVLGTIPTAAPNAKVAKPRDSEKILLLMNVGLVPFLSYLSYFWSQYGDLDEKGIVYRLERPIVEKNIASDDSAMNALFNVFDALLFGSLVNLPRSFSRPPLPRGRIYQTFFSAMTQFMVGHEIGHIALQHLTTGSAASISYDGGHSGHIYQLSHEQEFEADAMGLIVAQLAHEELARLGGIADKNLRRFGTLLEVFYGANLFFKAFDLLERACMQLLGLAADSPRQPLTHPPFTERRQLIYDMTVERSAEAKGYIDNAIEVTESVIDLLFERYMMHLSESSLAGLQPNVMWKRAFGLIA
jgi:hypothetical protein